jgi:hypothetical protein
MTYVTLTYNGTEKSLADWGISTWRREVYNQASDSFAFNFLAATDAAEIFPFGAMVVVQIGRIASVPTPDPNLNPTLPASGVTSFTGGSKWFVGYRVDNVRTGSAELEALDYKFAGPWDFFFERLVFQKLWLTWNGAKQIADWRSQVVLGLSVNALTGAGDAVTSSTTTNLMTIAQQLIEIAEYVEAQSSYEQTVNGLGWPSGAQIQFDNLTTDGSGNYQLATSRTNCKIPDFVPGYAGSAGDIAATTSGKILRAPLDTVNDMTCAECMRRMLRWIGGIGSPVTWCDYTTSPPTLKVSTVDQLNAITLPLVGSTESIKIKRRDDLVPSAIAFKYRISGQVDGSPYTVIENDVAATVDGAMVEGVGQFGALTNLSGGAISSDAQTQLPLQARRFGAQVGTFDFEGFSQNTASATITTAALNLDDPSTGSAPMSFWTSLFPELAATSNLAFYNSGNPTLTVLDNTGAPVNITTYPNILLDGQVAPWMYVNNTPTSNTPGASIEATITAYFSYAENASGPSGGAAVPTSTAGYHEKTVRVKLTNLSTGAYQSRPQITVPEPVPYGLAGYIYSIESIPQYQGTFTVVEQDITDVCPMGNCLNLSGGLSEWSAMRAALQEIIYDDTGHSHLTFGPAAHLGNADLVERLRVNRGPRWYYLIGNDLLNADPQTGPTELGKNLPKQSPSHGNKIPNWQLFASNLPDLQDHSGSYVLPPGISVWGKNAAPSAYSTLDAGPGVAVGDGSAGTQNGQFILISLTQLATIATASQPVRFFELNTCEGGDNTYYRTFLCTDKYHKT